MDLSDLIAKAVPFALPAFILASWLVNTKTPHKRSSSDGSSGAGESAPKKKTESQPAQQAQSSRDKEGALSDKDMTSP